jgi:hypothetical protein
MIDAFTGTFSPESNKELEWHWAIVVTLEKELPEAMAAYREGEVRPKRWRGRRTKLDSTARRKGVAPFTSLLSESSGRADRATESGRI